MPERRPSLTRLIRTRTPAMRGVVEMAQKVLDHDVNLLLLGETGTGKDFLAASIHACSERSARPFVRIDCASIPPELFESELFGYEKGAFTDAQTRKNGKLETARDGTVYFDDIATLSAGLQPKLLRTIQEKQFTRLGGNDTIRFGARIISSSNLSLDALLQSGGFRKDLYYRVNVVMLTLPPLRERMQDIEPLAETFLAEASVRAGKSVSGFDEQTLRLLRDYSWPGNLRELRNVVERAVIVESGKRISPESLPLERFTNGRDFVATAVARQWSLDQLEERYIREVLRQTRANYSKAAALLGIHRKTLLEKRKKYGIE
jgi:two-component system response regulator AtoC